MASQDPQREDYPPVESSRRRLHLREVRSESGDYDGIGAELRAARIRAGMDIADIGQKLRISAAYLESIEKGQFDTLPGHVYVIGFLKSYARFLDLDESIVVDRFRAETTGPRKEARLAFPSAMDRGRMPTGRLLLGGVLLAVLAYAGWFVFTSEERSTAQRVAPIPQRLTEATEAPAAQLPPPTAKEPVDLPTNNLAADPAPTSETSADAVPSGPGLPVLEAEQPDSPLVAVETNDSPVPAVVEPDVLSSSPTANDTDRESATVAAVGARTAAEDASGAASVPAVAAPLAQPPAPSDRLPESSPGGVSASPSRVATAASQTGSSGDVEIRQLADASSAPIAETSPPTPEPIIAATPAEPVVGEQGETTVAARGPETAPPPLATQIDEARSTGDGGYVPRVFGAGNENARVVLVAENDSWVQVRATSGELLLTRVLRPGDRYLVPNRPGLLLMTGNLGALEVIVDGAPIPRLGPVGVIGRDISLAVEDLRNRRGPVETGTGETQTDP